MTDRADKKGHDRDTAGTFVAEGEQDAENPANKYPPQAEDVNDFGNAEKVGFDVHGSGPTTPLREATSGHRYDDVAAYRNDDCETPRNRFPSGAFSTFCPIVNTLPCAPFMS